MVVTTNTITILAGGLRFPEGPAFAADGTLWLVELEGASLVRYSDGSIQKFNVGGKPNGLAIGNDGLIWYCDAGFNAIRTFHPETAAVETVVTHINGEPLSQPNDLAFDERGNLVFTCPGNSRKEPSGYVCALTTEREIKKITERKYFPNGLAFSRNSKELVIAETYQHRLWKGQWNASACEFTDSSIWCDIGGPEGPGGPDGMCFDDEGLLYTAVYGTGQIRISDQEGRITDRIQLPGKNPTNCCFHPSDKGKLIVTEAASGELLQIQLPKLSDTI